MTLLSHGRSASRSMTSATPGVLGASPASVSVETTGRAPSGAVPSVRPVGVVVSDRGHSRSRGRRSDWSGHLDAGQERARRDDAGEVVQRLVPVHPCAGERPGERKPSGDRRLRGLDRVNLRLHRCDLSLVVRELLLLAADELVLVEEETPEQHDEDARRHPRRSGASCGRRDWRPVPGDGASARCTREEED